jgi:hypothetical protein
MQRHTAKTGFDTDPRTGFQSGVYKRKLKKVRGDWKKLYNYDLRILYSSPHVTGIISSIRDDKKIQEICTKFSLEY